MNAFPVAEDAERAAHPDAPLARTAEEAGVLARGAAFLDVGLLPGAFASIAEAEGAYPGLYGEPRYEVQWSEGAWRVAVKFWRAAPALPVARDAAAALRRPLATARTPQEARAALGAPVELLHAVIGRRYRTHAQAKAAQRKAFAAGCARVVERDGGFAVEVRFWGPLPSFTPPPISPAEREAIAQRAAAPLKGLAPQLAPYVGLFERLAPENPAIVLAEEGDGRGPGD